LGEVIAIKPATIEGKVCLEDAVVCSGGSCVKRHAKDVWDICRRETDVLGGDLE
jgi:hypothetical protein